MALEITTPTLGKTSKSAKDGIITALMYEHPLTLTKLTGSVQKKIGLMVTFQGVRKSVNQLVEIGVVKKEGRNYSIRKEWIHKLRDFAEALEESYFKQNPGITGVESVGNEIKVYTFDNLIDLDKFWNRVIADWFNEDKGNTGEKYYVQQSGHTWYVLAQLEEETAIIEKIKENNINFYTLSVGDAALDRWCKKYYSAQGFYYTTSKKEDNTANYFAIYNDYVIQSTYPGELAEKIDQIYSKAKDFKSFDVTKLIKLLRQKNNLKITVMKNQLFAKQLRNYILSHFKQPGARGK